MHLLHLCPLFVFFSFKLGSVPWMERRPLQPGWRFKCTQQRAQVQLAEILQQGQRTPGAVRGAENEKNVFWVEEEGSWLCPPVNLFESRKERKKHHKCGYFFSLSLQQPWEFLRKLVLIPSSVSRDSTLCFLEFESEFDRISSSSRTHTRAHSHILRSHFSCIYPLESK